MTDEVTEVPMSIREARVLRLSGEVDWATVDRVAETLTAAAIALPPSGVLVIDLRDVATLSAAATRMLRETVEAATRSGVRCHLVVDPVSAVNRVIDLADPDDAVPRFADIDQAVAALAPRPATPAPTGRTTSADDTSAEALLEQFEVLTRTLLNAATVGAALRQVTDATTMVMADADLVSVTLRLPDGTFLTPVHTDEIAADLDQVQYRSGQGPCVDAARPDGPGYVTSEHLDAEDRWPEFADAAASHGYRTILGIELMPPPGPDQLSGALNIYSHKPGGFTVTDRHAAMLLATHASLALARALAVETGDLLEAQLRQAIDTRDVIGQAKGILMNRQGITADEAFILLRDTSQELNIKLVDLARTLTDRHTDLDKP